MTKFSLIISLLWILITGCSSPSSETQPNASINLYRSDTSAITAKLQEEFESITWERFVLKDLGIALITPGSWGSCPQSQSAVLCVLDSSSRSDFKSNIVVSVYQKMDLIDFEAKKQNDFLLKNKWTIVENNPNPYFWTRNTYTSYTSRQEYAGASYEIGMWCFAFESSGRVIEITLLGLLIDTEQLDYMFKFITSRIERI